jgi:hypothetical protein
MGSPAARVSPARPRDAVRDHARHSLSVGRNSPGHVVNSSVLGTLAVPRSRFCAPKVTEIGTRATPNSDLAGWDRRRSPFPAPSTFAVFWPRWCRSRSPTWWILRVGRSGHCPRNSAPLHRHDRCFAHKRATKLHFSAENSDHGLSSLPIADTATRFALLLLPSVAIRAARQGTAAGQGEPTSWRTVRRPRRARSATRRRCRRRRTCPWRS